MNRKEKSRSVSAILFFSFVSLLTDYLVENPNHNQSLDSTIKPMESPRLRSSPKPNTVTAEIHEVEHAEDHDANDDDGNDDDGNDDAKTKALAKVKKDLMIQ